MTIKIKKLKRTKKLIKLLKKDTVVTLIPYADKAGTDSYNFGLKLLYNGLKTDADFGTVVFSESLSKKGRIAWLDKIFYKSLINNFLLAVSADEIAPCISRVLYYPHRYFEKYYKQFN